MECIGFIFIIYKNYYYRRNTCLILSLSWILDRNYLLFFYFFIYTFTSLPYSVCLVVKSPFVEASSLRSIGRFRLSINVQISVYHICLIPVLYDKDLSLWSSVKVRRRNLRFTWKSGWGSNFNDKKVYTRRFLSNRVLHVHKIEEERDIVIRISGQKMDLFI